MGVEWQCCPIRVRVELGNHWASAIYEHLSRGTGSGSSMQAVPTAEETHTKGLPSRSPPIQDPKLKRQ